MTEKENEILKEAFDILERKVEELKENKKNRLLTSVNEIYDKYKNIVGALWSNKWNFHMIALEFNIRYDETYEILRRLWKEYGTTDKKSFINAFINKNENEEWYKKWKKYAAENKKAAAENYQGHKLAHGY